MHPPKKPSHSRGFTLLELLAVVTIVLLLAGMLYSGLKTALEKSRKSKCVGQLRAISQAISLYVSENNMQYPPSYGGVVDPAQTWWWYNFDSPLAGYSGNAETWMKITICDKNRTVNSVSAASNMKGYPYTVNYNMMPTYNKDIAFTVIRATQPSKPSEILLMTDSVKGPDWGWGFRDVTPEFRNWNRVSESHQGNVNALWCDGHVSSLRKSQIRSENCLVQ